MRKIYSLLFCVFPDNLNQKQNFTLKRSFLFFHLSENYSKATKLLDKKFKSKGSSYSAQQGSRGITSPKNKQNLQDFEFYVE